jgi:hypothetical protein
MTTHRLLRRRRLLGIVALSTVVGLLCAAANLGKLGPLSPHDRAGLVIGAAATHALVDLPSVSVVTKRANSGDIATLVKRTEFAGRLMISPPVLERIARIAKVPPDQIGGIARTTAFVPLALVEPASEQRAADIADSMKPYRLEVQANPASPVLDIYSQAPSGPEAERLANAAVAGVRGFIAEIARKQGVAAGAEAIQLRQLGVARGGVVNGGAAKVIGVLTFVTAFGLALVALLGLAYLRDRRAAGVTGGLSLPAPVPATPSRRRRLSPEARRALARARDDWPHTNRVLPWMFAVFLAVLWLVPFNSIQLNIAFPIDLKFDRLVLPLLVGAFVLAISAGGRMAPTFKLTWIHAAVGAFVACAFISVVLDARYLNRTLELELSLKKLPLLLSQTMLFVIAAAGIRRTEVRPFLTYTLMLAVVMALGMIWEYRMEQNLFYQWSDKLLPGIFNVTMDSETAVDGLGRRMVRGSAGVPLEAVTMLSLAMPIGLVRLLQSDRWRLRLFYSFASCALVAGMFATNRKSALLAPIAVVLAFAYFRRRELLKLAPLGMMFVLVITALSPGALGSTVAQFTRSDRSAVPTVSDRAADYDAVRPDVWTHFAFGRGWGSYNHESYRILDSEILHRTVEIGVLGLLTYVLMSVAVVVYARSTIAARDSEWAPLALVGAAAAIAFLVCSTLYDVMSFPHGPYIFLYIAGLTAVVVRHPQRRRAPARAHETATRHADPAAPSEPLAEPVGELR